MPLPIFSSRLQCSSSSSSFPRPKRRIDPSLTLIPGLSNDVAKLILSFVPYPHISRLKSTCKSWYAFLSSKTLISLRHSRRDNTDGENNNNLSHLLCIFPQDPSISPPFLFDPVTLSWKPLPLLPCNPHVYGLCNFVAVAIGPCVYVLGGSAFDTRSYPLDVPLPTSTVFRYSFVKSIWERLSPMLSPRGSFACAAVTGLSNNRIIVAGGGSRHTLFGAAGSRMSSVEMYDVEKDEWREMDELPRFRAGCVGFLVGNEKEKEKEREFWVMGGYGRSRTVSGILPVDEYYRDAAVMDLSGEKWRLVGDMWGEEERPKLGKIVAVDCGIKPVFFMLDKDRILRYEIGSNRWRRESSVPKKALYDEPVGFVALNGELHVMILLDGYNLMDTRGGTRQHRNAGSLMIHIYDPKKKTWRSVVTKPPFNHQLDLRTTVMCTIRL